MPNVQSLHCCFCENKNEFVVWEAVHFFIKQNLKVKIVEMARPDAFTDVMLAGAFKSMRHQHTFAQKGKQTIMKDDFQYEVPFGILGRLFDKLILKNYMTTLLNERNRIIKQCAETDGWKKYLSY
jgi:hypothetical protein